MTLTRNPVSFVVWLVALLLLALMFGVCGSAHGTTTKTENIVYLEHHGDSYTPASTKRIKLWNVLRPQPSKNYELRDAVTSAPVIGTSVGSTSSTLAPIPCNVTLQGGRQYYFVSDDVAGTSTYWPGLSPGLFLSLEE